MAKALTKDEQKLMTQLNTTMEVISRSVEIDAIERAKGGKIVTAGGCAGTFGCYGSIGGCCGSFGTYGCIER